MLRSMIEVRPLRWRIRFVRWAKGQKRPVRLLGWEEKGEGGCTDVHMIPAFLWRELSAGFYLAVPGAVFECRCHADMFLKLSDSEHQ